MTPKQIVIIGAGFGGVAAAKKLVKQGDNFEITVINEYPHHSIHGQLYEVATSPEELTNLSELKTSVDILLTDIFRNEPVKILIGKVTEIDLAARKVVTSNKIVTYDYLICALGSQPNFFSIPGALEYALPFQSSFDAIRIRTQIETSLQIAKSNARQPAVNVVIAGGGVAGCEIAAELQGMLNFVAWKNNFPREKLLTTIVDRSETVLSSFPEPVQQVAAKRLAEFGVVTKLGTSIQSISKNSLLTNSGELPYDVLIWAAGVRANPLPTQHQQETKKGDRVVVDEYFRLAGYQNVFVLGDQCGRLDETGNALPGTASQAIYQAGFVARAVVSFASNQQPSGFACKQFPYLIPLGPKWAIFQSENHLVTGYFGYLIRQFVWLRYYASILGWQRGSHWLLRTGELFSRND
jgi:NADH:ubiquinone reductase (H+-translocating)